MNNRRKKIIRISKIEPIEVNGTGLLIGHRITDSSNKTYSMFLTRNPKESEDQATRPPTVAATETFRQNMGVGSVVGISYAEEEHFNETKSRIILWFSLPEDIESYNGGPEQVREEKLNIFDIPF